MNNLEYLCENDRDALLDMACRRECNRNCRAYAHGCKLSYGASCSRSLKREWLEAEHVDINCEEEHPIRSKTADYGINELGNSENDYFQSKPSKRPSADSREKLEADIRKFWTLADGLTAHMVNEPYIEWLDRQAAITRAESNIVNETGD